MGRQITSHLALASQSNDFTGIPAQRLGWFSVIDIGVWRWERPFYTILGDDWNHIPDEGWQAEERKFVLNLGKLV